MELEKSTIPFRAEMEAALGQAAPKPKQAPDRWGDMREHVFWGALYHAALIAGQRAYPAFKPHRTPNPAGEFRLYLRHMAAMPIRRFRRRLATRAIRRATFPYHVALLQLAHDANFLANSTFTSQRSFLTPVFETFANGAPAHHHLVIKAHPLDDGREPLQPLIRELARTCGLKDRVQLLTGGKLAALLDNAQSAVTVNSTAAEQVLWRGLPLKAFGRAVYNRPEFVSGQSLTDFFANPAPPDPEAYKIYRQYLLQTSQMSGGFYSARSRRRLLRLLPDAMLRAESPYDTLEKPAATPAQHIRLVR